MIDGAIQALALFVLNSLYVSIYVESSQIAYFPAISAVATFCDNGMENGRCETVCFHYIWQFAWVCCFLHSTGYY